MSRGQAAPRHILITLDAVGGVWQYTRDLTQGLTAQGDTVTLAVLGPAMSDAQRADAAAIAGATLVETGLPLDWLCDHATSVCAVAAAIATLAHSVGADLVHLNTPALAVADFTQPVIAAAHGCVSTWWEAARPGVELPAGFAWHHELSVRGLAAADRLIAPTRAHAQAVQRVYKLGQAPAVVHNGRDPFLPDTVAAPAARAFTAGRLWDKVKRVDLLDQVAAALAVPLEAAGPVHGPNGEHVAPSHLRLLGTLDQGALAAHLAARPVFVSAASFEPFGLAVLEAAQAGCALVLADIASARELWDDAALFVPGDEATAYVHAIEALIRDPQRRASLGEAARARAARYTPRAMATATRAIHTEALGVASPERVAA